MAPTSRELAMLDLIVHELRTPLSVAAGSLPQMSAGIALTEPQRAAADRVTRALETLHTLTDQLRTWRRLADARGRTPVVLAAALAQALDSPDARKRDINFAPPGTSLDIEIMSAPERFIPALIAVVAAVVRSAPNRSTVPIEARVDDHEVRLLLGEVDGTNESEFPAEFVGGLGFSMPMARAAIEHAGGKIWSKAVDGRIAGIGLAMPRA